MNKDERDELWEDAKANVMIPASMLKRLAVALSQADERDRLKAELATVTASAELLEAALRRVPISHNHALRAIEKAKALRGEG